MLTTFLYLCYSMFVVRGRAPITHRFYFREPKNNKNIDFFCLMFCLVYILMHNTYMLWTISGRRLKRFITYSTIFSFISLFYSSSNFLSTLFCLSVAPTEFLYIWIICLCVWVRGNVYVWRPVGESVQFSIVSHIKITLKL